MKRKTPMLLACLLLFCLSGATVAQNKLDHLKSWEGKYPTERKGRVTSKFSSLPEIRTPLLKLLNRTDFNRLTNEYAVETPIKKIGDYLIAKNCRPHECGEQGAFAINLDTGDIYVLMTLNDKRRWFASKGNASSLPAAVKSYMENFGET